MTHEFQEGDEVKAIVNIDDRIQPGWRGTVRTVGEERYFGVQWPDLRTGWSLRTRDAGEQGWEVFPEQVRLVSPREETPIIEWWKDDANE
jgi:hypothetical protein